MIILSIDIGLINMGLVLVDASTEDFSINQVIDCKQINIKSLCNDCDQGCGLYHSNCMADYCEHLFYTYGNYFTMAEIILIERQPPQGFISIQELIVMRYREKIYMINPTSMHCHYQINGFSYERRKQFTQAYAKRWLADFEDFTHDRCHDVSDAMCMIIYYLSTLSDNDLYQKQIKGSEIACMSFEQFRYNG